MRARHVWGTVALIVTAASASPTTQTTKLADYKQEAAASVDGMYDLAQQMVDSVFSFSELGSRR